MRICIYTAIFGNYDDLKQPAKQSVPCDFLCFTDANLPRRVGAWRIIRTGVHAELSPRLRSKYIKVLSHEVFPGGRLSWRFNPLGWRPHYDVIIWVDGCLKIKSPDFAGEFSKHIGSQGWSMFIHPDRDCIYEEMPQAAAMRKCHGLPLAEQVDYYRAQGFPEHAGLMATTTIARSTGNPVLRSIDEAWWAEIRKWSFRDQLSLPVVLRRLGHDYDKVMLNLWDNAWFDWISHNSDL
jgi:hypothetical protein